MVGSKAMDLGAPASLPNWRRLATWLTVLLLPAIAITPLLVPGLIPTHDSLHHIFRAVQLEAMWQQGTLYSRWAPDLAYGLGFPVFNFYAPFTSYFLASLHVLGLSFTGAFKLGLGLCYLLAGAATYLFAREFLGQRGALLAAVAYVYAPYQMLNAYTRGDLAEMFALAQVPLLFLVFRRVAARPSLARAVQAAVALAALMLTHNVTALFLAPILGLYTLIRLAMRPSWRGPVYLVLVGTLGLGLSAFYWLPAFQEKDLVHIGLIMSPPAFDFHNHFTSWQQLLSVQDPVDLGQANVKVPGTVGGLLVALAGFGGLAVLFRRHSFSAGVQVVYFALVALVLAFLMTERSARIWETVPLLPFIQFPWRLLGLAGFAISIVAGAATELLPKGDAASFWRRADASVGLGLLVVVAVVPSFNMLYYPDHDFEYANPTIPEIVLHDVKSGELGTTAMGEYLPIWAERAQVPTPMLKYYQNGQVPERLNRDILPGGVDAQLVAHKPDYEAYRFQITSPVTILLNVFYFPTWHAYVDGHEVTVSPFQQHGAGLTTLTVPAGNRLVELKWVDTDLERLSQIFSIASLGLTVLLGAIVVYQRFRRQPLAMAVSGHSVPSAGYSLFVLLPLVLLLVWKVGYVDGRTSLFRWTSPPGTARGMENAVGADFEGKLRLLGYNLEERRLRAGEAVNLTIFWEGEQPLGTDFSVFLHVVTDPTRPPVAQQDILHPDNYPTTRWRPGKYVVDQHKIVLPENLPPGEYQVITGLYDPRPNGKRLIATGPTGAANYVSLGKITITP